LAREQQRAAAERARADRATEQLEAMRSGVDQQLRGDQARLSLLLDTVAGAVEGLRGELRLQAGTPGHRPADAVAGATTGGKARSVVNDPVVLERLLGVPNTHMIVDGYNVTKTGYPDLPLAEQRERLIRQLAPLAARAGVEGTVVVDAAGVVARAGQGERSTGRLGPLAARTGVEGAVVVGGGGGGAPAGRVRDVRVLFSEPGVSADEVIKNLVAAEPSGRPLLVVTADREIVRAVRDHDARAVSSAVLLEVVQPG